MPNVVSNTGPILALARIGQFGLLRQLFGADCWLASHRHARRAACGQEGRTHRRHQAVMERLRNLDFHMSADMYEQVIKDAGEAE